MIASKPRGAGNSRFEDADSKEFFPTPAWGTRALIEHVFKPLRLYDERNEVREPACGAGHMVKVLDEYYDDRNVYASDIEHRGWSAESEFLTGDFITNWDRYHLDWIITNPPFNLFMPFFECGMKASKIGIAMLVPLTIAEGVGRYKKIFEPHKGRFCVAPFVERLPILKNTVRKDATTARAYCWLVATHNIGLPPMLHIPPCRKQLEKDSDYDC